MPPDTLEEEFEHGKLINLSITQIRFLIKVV